MRLRFDTQLNTTRESTTFIYPCVPLRKWEGVTGFTHKRSLYGSFTLSTMRPLTKMKGEKINIMVVTV